MTTNDRCCPPVTLLRYVRLTGVWLVFLYWSCLLLIGFAQMRNVIGPGLGVQDVLALDHENNVIPGSERMCTSGTACLMQECLTYAKYQREARYVVLSPNRPIESENDCIVTVADSLYRWTPFGYGMLAAFFLLPLLSLILQATTLCSHPENGTAIAAVGLSRFFMLCSVIILCAQLQYGTHDDDVSWYVIGTYGAVLGLISAIMTTEFLCFVSAHTRFSMMHDPAQRMVWLNEALEQ